ncbi:MAG: cytochrome c biogenesis protein CcsA [Candidatus Adiutrix sp.]|jgi:ABC-type transport system involved in cytochrome c biogenesis permease subunit|nr:cytochrome c biogenesis protein CcsA [Candidatus Adiutrix sp.]
MTWAAFNWLAPLAIICWLAAAVCAVRRAGRLADLFTVSGLLLAAIFIGGLWLGLGRPPLRTMGETRLWYSFFLSAAGFLAYKHWQYPWLLIFSSLLAAVFTGVNLLKPEIHSAALMPALQSYYFVPHVTAYILSYSILAVATIAAVVQLKKLERGRPDLKLYAFMDNVVYIGLGFLMLGLITGAAWAKEAWGHYWSWDPKETWAFITAAAYLLYVHLRLRGASPRLALWVLPAAFILLMITWLGVSYLPTAPGSVHVYS